MTQPTDDLPAEALAALQHGQTVKAIRIVREARGLGLKEAKDAVDAAIARDPALRDAMPSGGLVSLVRSLFGGGKAEVPPPAATARAKFGGLPDPGSAPAPVAGLPAGAMSALDRGEIIEAIKIVREESGLGLAEAKARVDAELSKRRRPR